jgi:AcrR family transcriptional regulator
VSRSKPERTSSYHHGGLRRALLDAARSLAGEVGVDGFTLREVARRANVSHAAPYHHFADKAALVTTLAQEAFERLTTRLREASKARGSPVKKLEAVGIAYVEFALENRVEFRFMFRAEVTKPLAMDADFNRASHDAFQVLVDAIAACKEANLLQDTSTPASPLAAWSMVHGLAEILLSDPGRAAGLQATSNSDSGFRTRSSASTLAGDPARIWAMAYVGSGQPICGDDPHGPSHSPPIPHVDHDRRHMVERTATLSAALALAGRTR